MAAQFIAKSKDDWHNFKEFCWNKMEFPAKIEYKNFSGMRTIPQNRLQHSWYAQIGQELTSRGYPLSEEEAKKLMKHEFLGYEDIVIGQTTITGQLKSTAKLEIGESGFYMDQIDAWAADKGIFLIKPEDSEYMKYKEAQVK